MLGYIKQPFLGGLFSPKLDVMDREGGQTIATIQAEAKCFIGGMVRFWNNSIFCVVVAAQKISLTRRFSSVLVLQSHFQCQGCPRQLHG